MQFFGDQFFFGERVSELGVGTCLKKLTVTSLSAAIINACQDEMTIQRAKRIGEQIRKENGVAIAIQHIYRDLEYARELIKQPERAHVQTGSEESWTFLGGDNDNEISDEDDKDLFEMRTDENGRNCSILKKFKDMKLPNPLG